MTVGAGRGDSSRFSGVLVDALRVPATAATCAAAIAVTLFCWIRKDWGGVQIDPRGFFAAPWTPLLSAFAHVNTIHLLFNLVWVWRFGGWIERRVGVMRTLILYGVLAVVSAAAEYALFEGGIGLSAVGYGLFGLLYVRRIKDAQVADVLDRTTTQLFVGWFFLCVVLTQLKVMPVANAAHLFGALAGAGIGWVWNRDAAPRRWPTAVVGAAMALVIDAATLGRPLVNRGAGLVLTYATRAAEAGGRQEYAKALDLCSRALAIDPNDGYARWYQGQAQVMTGAELEGLASFRRAAERGVQTEAPDDAWLSWMQARVAAVAAAEDWPAVGRLANEMIRVRERSAPAWTWIGVSESRSGSSTQACTAFERAYAIDSSVAEVRKNMVWAKLTRSELAHAKGDKQAAWREIQAGLDVDPQASALLDAKRRFERGH